MTISNSYMEDEVRDGFPVPASIKRAWAVQLQILNKVDAICKKYNIPYYAESGTLLGVVRHGGYIPWDDDLDIVMKRHDYERFLDIAVGELPEGYSLINIYNEEEYDNYLTRIVNSKVINKAEQFLNDNFGCPYIMGIDLFVMDYLAPTEELLSEQKSIAKQIASFIKSFNICDDAGKRHIKAYVQEVSHKYNIELPKARNLLNQLYILMDGVMAYYSRNYKNTELKNIGLTPLWLDHPGSVYPKEYFDKCIWMDFETESIPVPVYYDAILSKKYGEYMRLVRQGSLHGYPFFEDQIKTLEDAWGTSRYDYHPGEEKKVLNKNKLFERRQKIHSLEHKNAVKKEYKAYTDMLCQAYESFIGLFEAGQIDTALSILEKCQEVAIALGNAIENRYSEGHKTVGIIEKYCESVFQLHNSICGEDEEGINQAFSDMARYTNDIEESIGNDILNKRFVAILPYKYIYWNQLENIYREENSKEDTIVYVIPLPYFERSMIGNIDDTNNVFCDAKQFLEKIKVYEYSKINLERLHPDVIIFQNPYDNYNSVTTINPYFYSERLYNYCDELIFVPPFKIMDFDASDNRAHRNIKDLIQKPGLIYADKIYLDSSKMRDIYIEKLTTLTGEDTKEVWEEKIEVMDNKEKQIIGSDDKKTILYYVSGSKLLVSKDKGIEKIRKTLQIFAENKGKLFVRWYHTSFDDEILQNNAPMIYKQYEAVVEEFINMNIGSYIVSDQVEEESGGSQAFYGDPGRIVTPMIVNSKPVMLQNVDI